MEQSALDVLREFVADVLAAHGNSYNGAMVALETDWLDLAITFQRAHALIERID
jgi:hypothetical protein